METIIGGFVNWKTSLTGVLGGTIVILGALGYIHPTQEQIDAVVGAALIIVGWFAKDSNKTGKPGE